MNPIGLSPNRLPRTVLLTILIAIILFVGTADYLTGSEISFSVLYIVPVALMVWYFGFWPGILSAFACTLISLGTDLFITYPAGNGRLTILYWNSATRLGILMIVTYILSSFKRSLEEEKYLARTDPVTGIANSRFFYEAATSEIERMKRYMHPLTIAYADIDNFKAINDRVGHAAGDALLRLIASTIRSSLRATDIVARLGGDEFGILMPETEYQMADIAIERIQTNISDVLRKHNLVVTLSYGMVTYRYPPESFEEILMESDRLMYESKMSGRNVVKHICIDEHSDEMPV